MSTIAIRWLGAFGRGSSLADSLRWELTENFCGREVAAEWIDPTSRHAREKEFSIRRIVGLLVAKGAILRRFDGDVWSVASESGRLETTRQSVHTHTECFCRPNFSAIVLTRPWGQIRAEIRRAIRTVSAETGLPVVYLHDLPALNRRVKMEF